jgi:membrane protein
MTYFSLLSLVPILMVGFAVAGIVLRNNQDLLAELLKRELTVMPAEIADRVSPLIDSVIANPFGIGITGLLIAMFSGICWMRNLRKATAVLWRPTLEQNSQAPHNIIGTTLRDLGALAGLTAVVVLSVGLSAPWDPSSRPRS